MTEPFTSADLAEYVEFLRDEMHRNAEIYGIGHPSVLEISRRLDEVLNYYDRIQQTRRVLIQAS